MNTEPVTAVPAQERLAGLSAASELLAKAKDALDRSQPEEARQVLAEALQMAPGCVELIRLSGIASQQCGRNAEAIAQLRRALASCPEDAVIHMNLGSALCEGKQYEEGSALLQRACALAPGAASAWYNSGKALKMQLRFAPACEALQHALAIDPAHIHARVALAHAQTSLGDIAGAVVNYREVLRCEPDDSSTWFALANMKTERFSAADVVQLLAALRRADDDDTRIELGFALAKAQEDQGDYPAAFAALQEANRRKRRQLPWNAAAERARVDAITAAFDGPTQAQDKTLGQEVIFIASLPRSGSTLTEQILASHPQVEGANEITDLPEVIDGESRRRGQPFPAWVKAATAADWARLGHEYLDRTARWRRERPRNTDKNLVSWQLAGAALRMLPGAKVVNARRDPLETCFSCYRQLFSTGNAFSYDLDDMASYSEDYQRLSRHWLRLFPQQVLDHEYEALLANPERQIRRLLDFCGLAFDPACLDFQHTERAVLSTASAAQVRQPLRAGAPQSAHYRQELAPLHARLSAAGLIGRGSALRG